MAHFGKPIRRKYYLSCLVSTLKKVFFKFWTGKPSLFFMKTFGNFYQSITVLLFPFSTIHLLSWTVWPDWAIFEWLWWCNFYKIAQIFIDFLGYFENIPFKLKLLWLLFRLLMETFGLIIIPTTGHTAPELIWLKLSRETKAARNMTSGQPSVPRSHLVVLKTIRPRQYYILTTRERRVVVNRWNYNIFLVDTHASLPIQAS